MSDVLPAIITTLGTLAGSFGGFTLAARSQRKQAERDDARLLRDAAAARLIALEDERHEFQLKTLTELQELVRLQARSTVLVIEQDRKTLREGLGYRLLPSDNPDDFRNSIDFSHNVARVTNPELRTQLERFSSLSTKYSLPPSDFNEMTQEQALLLQDRRFSNFSQQAGDTISMLGEHLRKEIDRHEYTQ